MTLLFALLVFIGDVTGGITLGLPQSTTIIIGHGDKAVTIDKDGHVKFAPGTTLDDATKTFWKAVETSNPLQAEVDRLKAELNLARMPSKLTIEGGTGGHCGASLMPTRGGNVILRGGDAGVCEGQNTDNFNGDIVFQGVHDLEIMRLHHDGSITVNGKTIQNDDTPKVVATMARWLATSRLSAPRNTKHKTWGSPVRIGKKGGRPL